MADVDEVNIRVLKKFDKHIVSILKKASHVTVYTFNTSRKQWEKFGVEGSMFVYSRKMTPTYGFFVLNRCGLNNIRQLVNPCTRFEISDPYLLYKEPNKKAMGIWFYSTEEFHSISNFLIHLSKEKYPDKISETTTKVANAHVSTRQSSGDPPSPCQTANSIDDFKKSKLQSRGTDTEGVVDVMALLNNAAARSQSPKIRAVSSMSSGGRIMDALSLFNDTSNQESAQEQQNNQRKHAPLQGNIDIPGIVPMQKNDDRVSLNHLRDDPSNNLSPFGSQQSHVMNEQTLEYNQYSAATDALKHVIFSEGSILQQISRTQREFPQVGALISPDAFSLEQPHLPVNVVERNIMSLLDLRDTLVNAMKTDSVLLQQIYQDYVRRVS